MLDNQNAMDVRQKINEIQQSRSKYQIEKFVLGQHHSPEMQYYQLCIETNAVLQSITETELRIKKLQAEAEELLATGKKSDSVEAEIKLLSVPGLETQLIGAKRELIYFYQLFDEYPEYSREQIEEAQQDYWETRLTRVAQLQMLSRQGGVDWAQLEAVYQAGIFETAISQIPTMHHLLPQVEIKKSRKKLK